MGALSIRNVRRSYGNVDILKGIDIEVESGDFLILVGPSGCGKSTLLNIIAGLDKPTEGEIHIGGRDVTHALPKDRDIAMVFQSYALYPNMNVAQNISFGLEMRNVPKAEREAAIAARLEDAADRAPARPQAGRSSPAASASAWRWAARWRATRRCSCSTSRCPTSTPSCAWRCAPRSSTCTTRRR